MHLLNLSTRGSDGTRFEKSCKSPASWRIWCPVDIILWVIIIFVLLVVFWKMYRSQRADHGSEASNQRQPFSPRPKPGNNTKDLPTNPESSDPYLVVHNLHDSIIANDPTFIPTQIPQPARSNRSSSQLTGLGITIGSQSLPTGILPMLSSQTLLNPSRTNISDSRLEVQLAEERDGASTLPPAYVHNPRVDS